ncbi:hypothetical protein Nepgr_009285 [Nepenthes gracilis]|uniref:Elongation factor P n=1 Tax=Nepenthes gracilis TaxID=150966 RepID=A0AAD3SAB5_NEPGR|nr:hypothetical protein Nepgr_009285 [Nepenthes gracilis]
MRDSVCVTQQGNQGKQTAIQFYRAIEDGVTLTSKFAKSAVFIHLLPDSASVSNDPVSCSFNHRCSSAINLRSLQLWFPLKIRLYRPSPPWDAFSDTGTTPLSLAFHREKNSTRFTIMGRLICKQLCQALLFGAAAATNTAVNNALLSITKRTVVTHIRRCNVLMNSCCRESPFRGLLATPWSVTQQCGAKVMGSEVRVGNIIQRKGRVYQVLKAQHTQHGRGGASIQVELRDVDGGNKVTERFRPDEAVERVFVEDKSFTYLYTEGNAVVLMDPKTFEQIEVSKELFGKAAVYLRDDMKVSVQYYDGRPMSASVPQRVTCIVVEAQTPMKGVSVTPQYKRVLLDNGLTILAPPFIVTGDAIVINTTDDLYITRAKE